MLLDLSILPKRIITSLYAEMENSIRLQDTFFTDITGNYISPAEPNLGDEVTIKIKASKMPKTIEIVFDNERGELEYVGTDKFQYYIFEYKFILERKVFEYYFEIKTLNSKAYIYNRKGLQLNHDRVFNYRLYAGFKTPNWAKGAVMYQIYVDRFYNGDKSNDVLQNEYKYLGMPVQKCEWDEPVSQNDVRCFYGGDLQGVIEKLDYIQELGVEAIYFNPLFVSPSNHKYDTQDYDYIDPHIGVILEDKGEILEFGKMKNKYATKYINRTTNKRNLEASNELFIKLVELAHERDIKVIIDGVFNHCGQYNKWLDTDNFYNEEDYEIGAFKSKDSIYHDYFVWEKDEWPNNDGYSSWWGHKNHPKLNFEGSEDLTNYIMSVARKWVSPPYNCDGWRLDVAADLGLSNEFNHKFWKMFRKEVKSANPEAIIISEHYGDPSSWLEGDEWDTIMNYDAFMEPLTWVLTGMEKHSEEYRADMLNNTSAFEDAMYNNITRLTAPSLLVSMNQLSNHDHSRFLTRTNKKVGRLHTVGKGLADQELDYAVFFEAVVFQMTWAGAPTIYYGDEIGMTGWTDPDNRRPFEWDNINENVLNLYKEAIKIRKENEALKIGSTKVILNSGGVISYGRWTDDNSIMVIINNTDFDKTVSLPTYHLAKIGNNTFEILLQTYADGTYDTDDMKINSKDNILELTLPPKSSKILKLLY